MNNDHKSSLINKRNHGEIKANRHSVISMYKQNGSLETKNNPHSNYRVQKQKMISRQTSTIELRPTILNNAKQSPLLGISNDYSQYGKENGFRSENFAKTFAQATKQKKKTQVLNSFIKRETVPFQIGAYNSNHDKIQNSNYKDFTSIAQNFKTDHSDFLKKYNSQKMACHAKNCNNQQLQFYCQDQSIDYAFCYECGLKYQNQGNELKYISQIKTINTPEYSQLIETLQKNINNFQKHMIRLLEHKKSVLYSCEYQLEEHDFYYDSLCQIILKKKQESRKQIISNKNQIEIEFKNARQKIWKQKTKLQNLLLTIRKDMVLINKMTGNQIKQYVNKQTQKIPLLEDLTKFTIYQWKVETVDLKEFEKDIQKYIIFTIENPEYQQCTGKQQLNSLDQFDNQSLNQLLCEQQLEWSTKTKLKNTRPKAKDVYFSFQKYNNNIIYENSEEYISSPGFKQI